MNKFYVYIFLRDRDSASGKKGTPYYVGKGKGSRCRSNQFRTAPKPLSSENIVFAAERLSESDAFQIEVLLIHLYGRIDNGTGCLRNRTDGGEGITGFRHSAGSKRMVWENRSEAARQKLRDAYKNRVYTDELRNRISEAQRGKKNSPESNEKRRAAILGTKRGAEETRKRVESRRNGAGWSKASEETKQKMRASMRGLKRSEETRKRISEALSKRIITEETRQKRKLLATGRTASPETREKMRLAHLGKKRGPYAPTRAQSANQSALPQPSDSEPSQQP